MITPWRAQLKNDLTFHSYIIKAFINANDQNNKLKPKISFQEFLDFLAINQSVILGKTGLGFSIRLDLIHTLGFKNSNVLSLSKTES